MTTAALAPKPLTSHRRREESDALTDARDPMVVPYAECERYRDYFKTEKTVSRTPRTCCTSSSSATPRVPRQLR